MGQSMKHTLMSLALLPICAVFASAPAPVERHMLEWNHFTAAHLLRRAGFAGNFDEIDRIFRMGRDRAVDYLVDFEKIPQSDPDYPVVNMPEPGARLKLAVLSEEDRTCVRDLFRKLGHRHMTAVREWWIRRMTVTLRPLEEKMTLFWHGHFCSGFQEVPHWQYMYEQNQLLRKHCMANFRDLLLAISKDPAMLTYLDGRHNRKEHPNENYGRELLELFTFGEGVRYTEKDVIEGARALTGWDLNKRGEVHFVPAFFDKDEKTYLGVTGRLGLEEIVDIILKQPECSRFLAGKLLTFFLVHQPDDAMIDKLAAKIRETNYDIRETLRFLFKSDMFYDSTTIAAQIKSPVELIVSTYRALEMEPVDPAAMYWDARNMGQDLFQPPNVAGWEGGRKWINASTLFRRYNFGARLLEAGPMTQTAGNKMLERTSPESAKKLISREMERISPKAREVVSEFIEMYALPPVYSQKMQSFNPLPILKKYNLQYPADIVAHFQLRLLSTKPDTAKSLVLVETLGKDFNIDSAGSAQRVRSLVHLIMSMPEYQLE